MKFNEELYEKTKELDSSKKEITSEDLIIEKKLLSLINKQLKDANTNQETIKIVFKSRFWGEPEEGYKLVLALKEKGIFNRLFREYHMYLGDSCQIDNEYQDAYVTIVWDYKGYIEELQSEDMKQRIREYERNKAKVVCENSGHDFGNWEYSLTEPLASSLPGGDYDEEDEYWFRQCKRCGYIEKINMNPTKYNEEVSKCEKEIKQLQDKLASLKKKIH